VNKRCIGFLTHRFDAEIQARFEKLLSDCHPAYDVYIVAEKGCPVPESCLGRAHLFDFPQLRQRARSVIGEGLYPGNHHLRNLDFFDAHPGYDFYWGIEYDVAYEGDWGVLLSSLDTDPSDLLGTHVRPAAGAEGWHWLDTLRAGPQASPDEAIIAFLPIWRMSHRAMLALAERVDAGWEGHFEILIPTALKRAGLSIADIGGRSPWTPRQRRQKHYLADGKVDSLSTIRHLPLFLKTPRVPGILYHPRKPAPITVADARRTLGHLRVELRRRPLRFAAFYLETLYRLIRRR
jgi:hypothetical protein